MTPKALAHLHKNDKVLSKLIKKVGPITLKRKRGSSPYEALVESVVYQQLTGKAAATIFGRVLALYPDRKFPTPEDLISTKDPIFRAAGLSGAKTAAIKDIAAKVLEGIVPDKRAIARLSNQEIIERLTQIRGVGQWTVEMLLIFNLGRTDVLPATDYGVRKGFALTYNTKDLPSPKELLAFGERWAPHRTTAAWYLWRALDLPQAKKNKK